MKVTKTRRGTKFDCYGCVKEFLDSGKACDRVYYPHKTAQICRQTINAMLKREHIFNVRVVQSRDYVILIKLDM